MVEIHSGRRVGWIEHSGPAGEQPGKLGPDRHPAMRVADTAPQARLPERPPSSSSL